MARGYNKVLLMGNLARDPEIRYTVDKRAWVRFTLAVGFSWKNKNGEYQDGADFVPVVAWGPLAERCGRYLKKGSAVLVEGKIKVRSYDSKDGSGKKFSTDIEAGEVMFVGAKKGGDSDALEAPSQGHSAFPDDADFGKSVREKGFKEDDFPMDFSELGEDEGEPEADIPF